MVIPPLGPAAAGKLSAKWASLFFCGVIELPTSLNLLRAALVASTVGIPEVPWAVCLESGKPEEGEGPWLWKCLGGGVQRALPPLWKMPFSGHASTERHVMFHYQTTITSSIPCTIARTLNTLQAVVFWERRSQHSSLLISSNDWKCTGTALVSTLNSVVCAFPSFLQISFERADNAWSILNTASEDKIILV